MTGTARIIRANSRDLPLAESSVDLIVTSPPYFALRSYQDGGEHYAGQLGSEPTPAEFVDSLIEVTRECMRVLKPSGSLWVNLGDKYAARSAGADNRTERTVDARTPDRRPMTFAVSRSGWQPGSTREKSLIGIPWRYALRCIDDLGLILRAEVIWSKPNGLPESVTDRVRRSHEQWFHFVQQPRYFSAVDEIREAHGTQGRVSGQGSGQRLGSVMLAPQTMDPAQQYNPLGKLPGSVWTVPTQPLTVPAHLGVDHFAAFPMEWPRRIIQGWSPSGVCVECGFLLGSTYDNGMHGVRGADNSRPRQDRARAQASNGEEPLLRQDVLESLECATPQDDQVPPTDDQGLCRGLESRAPDGAEVGLPDGTSAGDGRALGPTAVALRGGASHQRDQDGQQDRELGTARQDRARSLAQAGAQAIRVPPLRRTDTDLRHAQPCPNCGGGSFRPSVVVDVFGGTGTTALVAKALGCHGISVDMSADYCRLAQWRTNDEGEMARALQVDRPAQQIDGQGSLMDFIEATS